MKDKRDREILDIKAKNEKLRRMGREEIQLPSRYKVDNKVVEEKYKEIKLRWEAAQERKFY